MNLYTPFHLDTSYSNTFASFWSSLFRRKLFDDDDAHKTTETEQLYNTLYINVFIFMSLSAVFELMRHMKSIYMNRLSRKFIESNRVPNKPQPYPFAWIWTIMMISQEDFLRMVGLDGYMLMRYLIVCFRVACFYSFWGVALMAPIYSYGEGALAGWNRFTIANVTGNSESSTLWMPVIFCYLFAMFLCQLMYYEYKHFIAMRVDYLEKGDPDTQVQTYYTVMIEKLPSALRSTPALIDFFERLFPDDIYSVEIALDLNELEDLTNQRKKIRHNLEKSIALWKATDIRPTIWLPPSFYEGMSTKPQPVTSSDSFCNNVSQLSASLCGYAIYDAIEHYTLLLEVFNNNVSTMQHQYNKQRIQRDQIESNRLKELQNTLPLRVIQSSANQILKHTLIPAKETIASRTETLFPKFKKTGEGSETENIKGVLSNDKLNKIDAVNNDGRYIRNHSGEVSNNWDTVRSPLQEQGMSNNENSFSKQSGTDENSTGKPFDNNNDNNNSIDTSKESVAPSVRAQQVFNMGTKMIGSGVEGLAKESLKTAEYATTGALKGIKEATKALEYLTLGAYYRISSTAFVTFKSRFVSCCSLQMLLSHEYYTLDVQPAPNPKNIIWENVSIPLKQIQIRRSISDGTLMVGAVFWSIVVAFISAISNLESISQEFPVLQQYSDTDVYKFFNNYLAIGVLLILLSLLPFVFDFISRNYEGLKMESEIQNSVMTRYFYYQLANVFVAVGLGSIATSIHQILEYPSSILSILGNSVPSFSIYFANLIITRTFTGLIIEMLRIFPLLQVATVACCSDKRKYTRRELRQGPFADPPMLYGWIYPNILMVVMIMVTFSCLAPFISPLCIAFFGYAYLMYKYQLLFVYINSYQAGGYMWYAVFDRTMLALLCGVFTLLCYLAIRQTYVSGPFYAILPLPVMVLYFWRYCNSSFRGPANHVSVEKANEIDARVALAKLKKEKTPQDVFVPTLFRQPSLVEGRLRPAAYRATTHSANHGSDEEEGIRIESKNSYREQSLHSIAMDRTSDSFSASDFNTNSLHSMALVSSIENGTAVGSIEETNPQVHSNSFTTPTRHSHATSELSHSHQPQHTLFDDTSHLSIDANFIDEDVEIEKEVNDFLENNGSILSPAVSRNSRTSRTSLGTIFRLTTGRSSHQANENLPILEETETADPTNYGSVDKSIVELKNIV